MFEEKDKTLETLKCVSILGETGLDHADRINKGKHLKADHINVHFCDSEKKEDHF